MHNYFLFVALPYVAIFSIFAITIYRFNSNKYGFSSLSSQFLEKEKLLWGSIPWHIGIFIIVIGHGAAFFTPKLLQSLVSNQVIMYVLETIGLTAAFFALFGLIVLFTRRLRNSRIQAVTSNMDLVILTLLTVQILLGILTAVLYKWGSSWSPGVIGPYMKSIFTFNPDLSYVQDLPFVIKTHIVIAWLIILLVPFTRLVHMFSLPITYLTRLPQVVVWSFRRQKEAVIIAEAEYKTRRHFLKASIGIAAGSLLLLLGVADKIIPFFMGPSLSKEEKAKLLKERLEKIKQAVKQKELEHERLVNEFIYIANLENLKQDEGIYFIDYKMKPGLAFKGEDGLPILYSAKCTHLGCTIANKVKDGKLLCPCHVSHFDIKTGDVIDGPALEPLPKINYLLKDSDDQVVVEIDRANLSEYKVYIGRSENV